MAFGGCTVTLATQAGGGAASSTSAPMPFVQITGLGSGCVYAFALERS
jgi:hypothetical protein